MTRAESRIARRECWRFGTDSTGSATGSAPAGRAPKRAARALLAGLAVGVMLSQVAAAQNEPQDARSSAPIDLEGYWIGVLSEDWRWRAVTPPKGDVASVPLNPEGIRVANEWDPDADPGSCLPYGAPNLMRMPMRVRLEWAGPDRLVLTTDHGMQTRELIFGEAEAAAPAARTRQGHSVAAWERGALMVTTTGLLPGWLRRNGVPYSASAEVTEYYNTHSAYGDDGFTVTTIVRDPVYLTGDFVTSTTFVRLPDGSDWNPTPCDEPSSAG